MEQKERCEIPVTWHVGDRVSVDGKVGKVAYIYTNGYTLVDFNQPIIGGIFNNNSTFGNEEINHGR